MKRGRIFDELGKAHPNATRDECKRFLQAFGKKHGKKHLAEYLSWRTKCGMAEESNIRTIGNVHDKAAWLRLSSRALQMEQLHAMAQSANDQDITQDCIHQYKDDEDDERDATKSSCSTDSSLSHLDHHSSIDEAKNRSLHSDSSPETGLPQFVFSPTIGFGDGTKTMRDLRGHRILHVLPAILDLQYSEEAYTTCLAMYLEQVFQEEDRDRPQKRKQRQQAESSQITVLLDVRPGRGWPNAHATTMVGLIRNVANTLHTIHPCRLDKCILFPIPRAAIFFWNLAIKPFLNSQLARVMELVPGPAMINSPPPNDKLSAFVAMDNLEELERRRLSCFNHF